MKQFIEEDWDSPSGNGHENIKLYYKKKSPIIFILVSMI